MNDFMQRQITTKQHWVEIETTNGTWFVPYMDVSNTIGDFAQGIYDGGNDPDCIPEEVGKEALEYTECFVTDDIHEINLVVGYGARLSAPGYMDCTEWSVFETKQEANEHLDEMYGDE